MTAKPSYEELERRVQELEKIESEHKYSREALQKNESLFKVLYEKAPLGYQSLDENGHFIVVNQAWLDTLGYTREEVIGKSFADFLHPDWQDHFKENFPRFKAIGEILGVEFEMVKKNGDLILVSFTGKIGRDKNGDFQQTHCIFHDITERKRAEDSLWRNEKDLRESQRIAHVGSWRLDVATNEVVWTEELYNIYGFDPSLPPPPYTEHMKLFTPEGWERLSMALDHTRESGIPYTLELETVRKDGSNGWIWVQGEAEVDSAGKTVELWGAAQDITERKRTEETLRKSEERFLLAMKASNDGLFDWNLETNDIYYSPAWKNMLGYEDHELPNDFSIWEKTTDPEDAKKSWELQQKLISKQIDRFVLEFKMKHKDGHWVDILSRAEAIFNDKGKAVRIVGTHVDITERKQAEVRLKTLSLRHEAMLDAVPEIIMEVDNNKIYTWANAAGLEFFGKDALGKEAAFFFEGEQDTYSEVQPVFNGHDELIYVESWQRRKDGEKRLLAWFCRSLKDVRGQATGALSSALDITERKQAEANLKMAHEKMLTILDSIDSTVYVADMETYEILFMNQKMITDFGGDKTGSICFKEFRKNTEICDFCTNKQLIDGNGRAAGVCTWHDHNPVNGKFYINHDRAIEWTDGRLVRMQIATDITDLKKMEAQLLQAQKMESVGRLAGGVAHDFNNMLGVILGHAELALERVKENHDIYSDLKEIQKAAQRSADLTKQLLTFARKQIIEPKMLNLNQTVKQMITMLQRLIGEDIDLLWKPAKNLWSVKMDPSQIDQILANLLVNARDAIAGVGKITIETGMVVFDEVYCAEHAGFIPGDFVLLGVSDDGSGMDKETLNNLFEPFFTTKEMGKGTGLGLATVYGIVKQNKGFINVYSEPGRGSSFKIYLPRLFVEDAATKGMPDKKTTAGGTETILLVEDEPAILRLTRMMLERKGYSILSAATPAEAIEMAGNHTDKIHLLMTDVVMPGMNGRDLARQLTALYPDLKLLFMSGYTANVIAHQGVLDEGVAFIQKPFSMADLAEKVRRVLDAAPN